MSDTVLRLPLAWLLSQPSPRALDTEFAMDVCDRMGYVGTFPPVLAFPCWDTAPHQLCLQEGTPEAECAAASSMDGFPSGFV